MTCPWKRVFALLLVLVMAFGLLPGAVTVLAAEEEPRDTEFFTPQEHTDLNYDEIEYEHIDPAELIAEIDALRELMTDAANADAFLTRFQALADEYMRQQAMYIIVMNMVYADSRNEWAVTESENDYDEIVEVGDAFNALVRDALSSPCAGIFDDLLTEDQKTSYLYYEDKSDEEKDLLSQETALENEYRYYATELYTVEYDGVVYDDDSAWDAYTGGEITYDDYTQISRAVAKAANAVLGDIFVRLVKVRNQIARLEGFDNYVEYAYWSIYGRDFWPEDAQVFEDAVKADIAPLLRVMQDSIYSPDQSRMPEDVAVSGEGMFATLLPCFAKLSDELLESAQYTWNHKAYDVDPGPNKTGTAYSWMIPYYNIPFYFNNASGNWSDLCDTIHELGHNNEAYWHVDRWNTPMLNNDSAEVNSQGLELLMLNFYPEIFGDEADAVQSFIIYNKLYSVVSGALNDELERRVYELEEPTLTEINQIYCQLCRDYCCIDEDDERTELYGWYEVPHHFTDPLYYISYGVSAAGAFAFWDMAQEDYLAAVDNYMRFTAIDRDYSFQDTFLEIGMKSPLDQEYIRDLGELIHEKAMGISPFTDVFMDDWCGVYVSYVYHYDLMNGVSPDTFAPDAAATRAQLMTVLARSEDAYFETGDSEITLEAGVAWAMENGISDGSDLSGDLTREQLACMFYRFAQHLGLDVSMGEDTNILSYEDAFDISDWAMEAMQWACAVGLLEDTSVGRIAPQGEITRAYLAMYIQYFWWYVF